MFQADKYGMWRNKFYVIDLINKYYTGVIEITTLFKISLYTDMKDSLAKALNIRCLNPFTDYVCILAGLGR